MATVTWSIGAVPWQVRLAASTECAALPDSRCADTWLAAQVLRAQQDGCKPQLWNDEWQAELKSVPELAKQLRGTPSPPAQPTHGALKPLHLAFLALRVVDAVRQRHGSLCVRRSQLWPHLYASGATTTRRPSWRDSDKCITFPRTNWAVPDDRQFGRTWHAILIPWVARAMDALGRRDVDVADIAVQRMYWAGWLFAVAMRNHQFEIGDDFNGMLTAIKTTYGVPINFPAILLQQR